MQEIYINGKRTIKVKKLYLINRYYCFGGSHFGFAKNKHILIKHLKQLGFRRLKNEL